MELHYLLGLVLCGEKSTSSAFNVGSVTPSPYRSFQSLQGVFTPTTPQRLFLAPLRNALVSIVIPLPF